MSFAGCRVVPGELEDECANCLFKNSGNPCTYMRRPDLIESGEGSMSPEAHAARGHDELDAVRTETGGRCSQSTLHSDSAADRPPWFRPPVGTPVRCRRARPFLQARAQCRNRCHMDIDQWLDHRGQTNCQEPNRRRS